MKKRILLTGASGLLGSALLECLSKDHKVIAVYQSTPLKFNNQNLVPVNLDLNNSAEITKLFIDYSFDLIINCAGASDVDRCELDENYARSGNVEIVKNLINNVDLEIPLIHFSSDYIFSGKKVMPTEADLPEPINQYGITKLLAEKMLTESAAKYKIIRICSLYSIKKNATKNLATSIISSLEKNNQYYAADDLISNHTNVNELAEVVTKILLNSELPKILHIASKDANSRYQFAIKLAKTLQLPADQIVKSKLASLNLPADRPKLGGLSSIFVDRFPDIALKRF